MTILLSMLLANAVLVIPLAAFAWGINRWFRRPAVSHLLWVIVLLKLVTPPFFQPFSIHIPIAASTNSSRPAFPPERDAIARNGISLQSDALSSSDALVRDPAESLAQGTPVAIDSKTQEVTADSPAVTRTTRTIGKVRAGFYVIAGWLRSPWVTWFVLGVWCMGTIAWFVSQVVAGYRFWVAYVRDSVPDRALQTQAENLAKQFSLRACPTVFLMQSQLSPMIWGYGGRLRLLFPCELAERLDHDSRGTLLAHELAHYGRGDHWIRVLELLVTGLFWWHPVVWVARRHIEEFEEECCDAWVVTKLPHPPRRYAEALLDTIDFLCDIPAPLPPLASGLGPAAFLRRRLTRIMQGVTPTDLSLRQRCAVALIALMSLPLQPFVLGSNARLDIESLVGDVDLIEPADDILVENPDSLGPTSSSEEFAEPRLPPPPVETAKRAARGERVWGSAVSSNGHYAMQITTAGRVFLTDLATNQRAQLQPTNLELNCVAFCPDGESFVAGGTDGRVTLWSAASASLIRELHLHDDVVRSVAVAPQGKMVAVGGRNGSVTLLDMSVSHAGTELVQNGAAVNSVRFSPDGRRLAVATGEWNTNAPGQVTIWNLETGKQDAVLTCETAPGAVSFVSNEELIVGQWDGGTSLWNLLNRQIVGSAIADKQDVTAASFSPDNPSLREVIFVAPKRVANTSASPFANTQLAEGD